MIQTAIDLLGVNGRNCRKCNADISNTHALRKYCEECNKQDNAGRTMLRKEEREEDEQLKQIGIDYWLRIHNRGRAFSTFGKHDPLTELPSVQVVRRKDRVEQRFNQSRDETIKVQPVRFRQVTPGDVDWANRQKPFTHTAVMPRHFNSYCANCIDMVIDGASNKVRITKGVYLPIEHECNRVRVYNLQGKLIEVKGI